MENNNKCANDLDEAEVSWEKVSINRNGNTVMNTLHKGKEVLLLLLISLELEMNKRGVTSLTFRLSSKLLYFMQIFDILSWVIFPVIFFFYQAVSFFCRALHYWPPKSHTAIKTVTQLSQAKGEQWPNVERHQNTTKSKRKEKKRKEQSRTAKNRGE